MKIKIKKKPQSPKNLTSQKKSTFRKDIHFSSASAEWETPPDLFKACEEAWGPFLVDLAASSSNNKCVGFYTKEVDALKQPWGPRKKNTSLTCWVNPPYTRKLGQWVAKAIEETSTHEHLTVVMLIPARTSNRWFGDIIRSGAEVRFLPGRVKFLSNGGVKNSAPFPSIVVIFGSKSTAGAEQMRYWDWKNNKLW